jgi:hypothetical protein
LYTRDARRSSGGHKVSLRLGRWKSFVRSFSTVQAFASSGHGVLIGENVNEWLSQSTCVQCDNIGLTLVRPLFNPFQILRDVFFREAQRSTCAITGQPLTSNLTHHCRAGDATTKLPDILDGVLSSLALQRRASLNLLRYLVRRELHSAHGDRRGPEKS